MTISDAAGVRQADLVKEPVAGRTWICPRELDRARLRDNSARITRARMVVYVSIGVCLIYAAPVYGWWILGLLAISAVNTQTLEWRVRRSARPEYHVAVSIVLSQALVAAAAAFTGGPKSVILPLVAVPTAFAAPRFRTPVAIAASGIGLLLTLVATLGLHPAATIADPAPVIVACAVIVGVSAAAQALTGAELQYRDTAILDPLTGLLNRQGLDRRFDELAEQARLTGAPISLLVCDVDHFKAINDAHGHAMGDAVLRDIAYRLRKQMRSFELIYRIGGEEFLVVLPGAALPEARALAERLCQRTRDSESHGVSVTVSVGVSTLWGDEVKFSRLFALADKALYAAKASGRDRVACADEGMRPPPLSAASA
jgi:diguanylate cyclase (GGDEF)-like protein